MREQKVVSSSRQGKRPKRCERPKRKWKPKGAIVRKGVGGQKEWDAYKNSEG